MTDRDQRIMGLFLAGASYHQIAQAVEADAATVHKVVSGQLENTDNRRKMLTDHRYAINLERTEALLKAHWAPALRGDPRSAELCRRILERQLLQAHNAPHVMEGDAVDEIAARRAARRSSPAARSSRAKRSS